MHPWRTLLLLTAIASSLGADQPDTSASSQAADQQALAALQSYIGLWRGVGQVQRGSTKGAWVETADWAWRFERGRAWISFAAPQSKYLVAGEVHAAREPGCFELLAAAPDEDQPRRRFTGQLDDQGRLVFTAQQPADGALARITLRQVADGARLVAVLEKRLAPDRYAPLAEIGYTRAGAQFAQGSSKPECIVTGGAGTIPVTFEGRTYYVCCTGCKELFEADPAAVLAKYKARQDQEKK